MKSKKKPLSGKKVLLYFVLFFGFVFVMDALFISIALKSHTGVITDQAYERGLDFDKWDTAAKQELDLNSQIEINSQKIRFYIESTENGAIESANVKVHGILSRNDKTDFKLLLKHTGAGWYETDIVWPQDGNWDLYFTVVTPEGTFYKKQSYRYLRR